MPHSGLILGRDRETGELIRHNGEAHAITIASTGRGKTTGPVITNARTYPGQFITIDVKGEVYRHSADYRRALGQEVYVIDLSDEPVAPGCLNPFDIGRRMGSDMVSVGNGMAKEMASTNTKGGAGDDNFWNNRSVSLIRAGVVHFLVNKPEAATLLKLHDIYSKGDVIYNLAVLLDTVKDIPPVANNAISAFLNLTDVTRSGVLATVEADLQLFGTTLCERVTANTSFDLDRLVEGRPMSLYFIVPPDRIRPFSALLRLWFTLLMFLITKRREKPKHPTLFLIDEAAQLGRMDSLLTAMTLLRSYSLRVWSIWQSGSQLKIYGNDAETLLDNAGIVQVMGLANMRAARDTADLMGGITAEELKALKPDEQVLMIDGQQPFVAKQVRYYSEQGLWPTLPSHSR